MFTTEEDHVCRYCTHCGRELMCEVVGAEKMNNQEYSYDKYNEVTGTRQHCIHKFCPKKKFFFSSHDDFYEDED